MILFNLLYIRKMYRVSRIYKLTRIVFMQIEKRHCLFIAHRGGVWRINLPLIGKRKELRRRKSYYTFYKRYVCVCVCKLVIIVLCVKLNNNVINSVCVIIICIHYHYGTRMPRQNTVSEFPFLSL